MIRRDIHLENKNKRSFQWGQVVGDGDRSLYTTRSIAQMFGGLC